MHGEGQALALREEAAFFHRSAGACPPRFIDRNEKRPSLQGFKRFLSHPMHGEGQALALR